MRDTSGCAEGIRACPCRGDCRRLGGFCRRSPYLSPLGSSDRADRWACVSDRASAVRSLRRRDGAAYGRGVSVAGRSGVSARSDPSRPRRAVNRWVRVSGHLRVSVAGTVAPSRDELWSSGSSAVPGAPAPHLGSRPGGSAYSLRAKALAARARCEFVRFHSFPSSATVRCSPSGTKIGS